MTFKIYFSLTFILLFLNSTFFDSNAQNKIKGTVTDSITNEALPFVSVYVPGTTIGTMTDNSGKFLLVIPLLSKTIAVTSIAYKEKTISLTNEKLSNIRIQLSPASYSISEVIVKPKKERYRRKGNPAVDFVKKVIESKEQYSPYNKDYYQYTHYEKINFAVNVFEKEEKTISKFSFLTNYLYTSELSGKQVLPISTKEMLEEYYFQKSPHTEKRIVKAKKSSGLDEMLSENGVEQVLSEVFKDIDIYDNNINLFLKPFVSPLSTMGPSFYKYYLLDTVLIADERCVDLGFVPFSSQSTGFTGHLYITLDSTNFVKKVKLNLPRDINLNFVQNMSIEQQFNRAPDGTRLLMRDDIIVEFSILTKSEGLYARRTNTYAKHSFIQLESLSVFKNKENTLVEEDATLKPESYWVENRLDTIGVKENSVDQMLVQLRKNPLFYYSEKVLAAMVTGYVETAPKNSKINIGPMYSTVSSNSVEGLRLRAGGMTTAHLNKHLFFKGYMAYGFKDQKPKYNADLEYSFNKKKEQANEFPIHSIKASYKYDLNRLGQHYLYSTDDNMFLSLKRQKDDKITYMRVAKLSYNKEFYSHFSAGIDVSYRTEYATPYLVFRNNTTGQNINSYSLGDIELRLRYAPGEKFYPTTSGRLSFSRNAPVFTFSHVMAKKGVLNSDYDYSYTELGFKKRFWFSAFGNANVIVKAGKVWTKAPFPLLIIPNANLSYTIQYESYPMMNALEFINDQYVSWDLNYNMNGLILNRIPLIKYMKLREILSFRGLYGDLSKKNDPAYTKDLFQFPASSYKMGNVPYMEAGVGVENIFKIIRIDYVWRLTYLNHPNIEKGGIRVSMNFSF